MRAIAVTVGLGLLAALTGCAGRHPIPSETGAKPLPVATLLAKVRGEVERSVGTQQAATLKVLAEAVAAPVPFKQLLAAGALADPWQGFSTLEQQVSHVADAADPRQPLHRLLAELERLPGRHAAPHVSPAPPASAKTEDQLAYLEALLAEAVRLRTEAIGKLTDEERRFLFDHAAVLAERFSPQLSEQQEDERRQAQMDRRFFSLAGEKLNYASLLAAAQLLASLDDEDRMDGMRAAFTDAPALTRSVPGIAGSLLLFKETEAGAIVIGGAGPNSYDLSQPIALLLDLGGDDIYHGTIASPRDVLHGISLVLDLDGNDSYEAQPLGLATGRLGVGLLIDRRGDDLYRLEPGSGGVGLAGIGLLDDREGNDRYAGSRLTEGAAIGGLGLLMDRSGDDAYGSFGYALGFGGPLGLGAVIDVAGQDRYQCGDRYPSRYNEQDAPQAKPGEALFQYECFGMGAGVGQRLAPKLSPPEMADVAGGIGLALDLAGDDRWRSANFSQGIGYVFGIGVKLDRSGDDEHLAARYGLAAAAHSGVGLLVDGSGADRYGSSGPFYNGAAAWDRSVALFVDGGEDDDRYDLQESTGLGIADQQAWSLFIDEGGTNRYAVRSGKGRAGDGSVSVFIGH